MNLRGLKHIKNETKCLKSSWSRFYFCAFFVGWSVCSLVFSYPQKIVQSNRRCVGFDAVQMCEDNNGGVDATGVRSGGLMDCFTASQKAEMTMLR